MGICHQLFSHFKIAQKLCLYRFIFPPVLEKRNEFNAALRQNTILLANSQRDWSDFRQHLEEEFKHRCRFGIVSFFCFPLICEQCENFFVE